MEPIKIYKQVEEGREAGDRSSEDQTARPQHSPRFPEGEQSIPSFYEVVEGPQQQDGVGRRGRPRKVSGVPDLRRNLGMSRSSLIHVKWDRVDHVNPVPLLGEPRGIDPWTSSDIQDLQ